MPAARRLLPCLTALAAMLSTQQACAELPGLRPSMRSTTLTLDTLGALRLSLQEYPQVLGTPSPFEQASRSDSNLPGLRADWHPFDNGWRTTAGLTGLNWRDPTRSSVDASQWSSRAFLGLGWSTSGSSSSSGSQWHFSADIGAMPNWQDCRSSSLRCATNTQGLQARPGSSGIRWNPFISIGASIHY